MHQMRYSFNLGTAGHAPVRPAAVEPPPFPPLVGKHVGLRPIMPSDYALLQMLETNGEVGARWRFRGQTMSPEQWASTLWQGVLAQFLVFAHGQEMPVGMVKAYRASFQDRTAYLGGLRFDPADESPLMMRGFALFIEYVFDCFGFRKLYLEAPSYNVGQFASGIGRYFEVEGQLADHFEYGGRLYDLVILTVDRERWRREARRVIRAEVGGSAAREVRVKVGVPA